MNVKKRKVKINVKKIIFLLILIAIFLLTVIAISKTMARYKSLGKSGMNTRIAFYAVKDSYQTENIFLNDLYPKEGTFDYTFTVTNKKDNHVTETAIDYTVDLEVTTNLPLKFTIYKDNVQLSSGEQIENKVEQDESGNSYIRKIKIKNQTLPQDKEQTDTYQVKVEFPIKYAKEEEFEGMIDNINVKFNSKQKIEE